MVAQDLIFFSHTQKCLLQGYFRLNQLITLDLKLLNALLVHILKFNYASFAKKITSDEFVKCELQICINFYWKKGTLIEHSCVQVLQIDLIP